VTVDKMGSAQGLASYPPASSRANLLYPGKTIVVVEEPGLVVRWPFNE
jgi:hypothetical protein